MQVVDHSPAPKSWTIRPGLALIFDMDGVVVDSMPIHRAAWRQYLEGLGIAPDDHLARMHGRRNDEIVLGFLGPAADQKTVEEHGAAKERLYRRLVGDRLESQLVPGVRSFLQRVSSAPIGLASNAERLNIDFVLDGAGLRPYFRVIVDGSQVERPKPAPDVYLRAAQGSESQRIALFFLKIRRSAFARRVTQAPASLAC